MTHRVYIGLVCSIVCFVCGCGTRPPAVIARIDGNVMKVYATRICAGSPDLDPGRCVQFSLNGRFEEYCQVLSIQRTDSGYAVKADLGMYGTDHNESVTFEELRSSSADGAQWRNDEFVGSVSLWRLDPDDTLRVGLDLKRKRGHVRRIFVWPVALPVKKELEAGGVGGE